MSKLPKVKGFKRFLHIFSSAGASVVISGALFKIMHWPGWDVMLITGMLTESVIFILFAFDIPHEEYDWTLAYPELAGMGSDHTEEESSLTPTQQLDIALENAKIGPELMQSLSEGLSKLSETAKQIGDISNAQLATNEYIESVKTASENANQLANTYAAASDTLNELSNTLSQTKAGQLNDNVLEVSETLSKFSKNVAALNAISATASDTLNELSNTLSQTKAGQLNDNVLEVSETLSKFSKNVAALNATYELQLQTTKEGLNNINQFYDNLETFLKNISDASADTKKYKEEISTLTNNLSALNTIYGNMLNAMSYKPVNQY